MRWMLAMNEGWRVGELGREMRKEYYLLGSGGKGRRIGWGMACEAVSRLW